MFLKFPSTQHKQETCSESPGGANSTLPAEGGGISTWGCGGRGSSQLSRGTPQPSPSPLTKSRENRAGGRKDTPLQGKSRRGRRGRATRGRPVLQSESRLALRRWPHVAGAPGAERSPRPGSGRPRRVGWAPAGPGPAGGGGGGAARARRRRRAGLGCQTWLKCRRCRRCRRRENAEPSRARWAAAARAATGTRFSGGAAAAAMARLADYFIVVGYDHEKPGEAGGGRRPRPPGCGPVGGAGPGGAAGREGRREGLGGPRRSGGVGVRPSRPRGASRWACATGTRAGEGRRPRPSGPGAGGAGRAGGEPTPGSSLGRGPRTQGSARARAGGAPGPQGWEGGRPLRPVPPGPAPALRPE